MIWYDSVPWNIVAVVSAVAPIGVFIWAVFADIGTRLPTLTDRPDATALSNVAITRSDVVKILLDDLKAVAATRGDGERNIDTKAAQMLGLVGGGIGIAAIVNAGGVHPTMTPLLMASLAALGVIVLSAVLVLRPRRRNRGTLTAYTDPAFLNGEGNDARLSYELAQRYQFMAKLNGRLSGLKAHYYFAMIVAFVLGITCVVFNSIVPLPAVVPSHQSTTTHK